MADVYQMHRTAFASVSAYVVLKGGERVATVALKHGNSVTAYVHWIGVEMAKDRAGGGGYDRASAAVGGAATRINMRDREDAHVDDDNRPVTDRGEFVHALRVGDGRDWTHRLTDAGFTVLQAI